MLVSFYFADPRAVLVPIEHLSPRGMSAAFADALAARRADAEGIRRFVDAALPRYWERCERLASRSRAWPHPRIRNIAIVDPSTAIPPYVQLLNTSTWTLFDCELDRLFRDLFDSFEIDASKIDLTGLSVETRETADRRR